MAKNEKDKQTTAHTTQHRKLKNKQHEPHQKTRGDPAPHAAPVVLLR